MIPRALAIVLLLIPAPAAAGVGGEIAYSLRGGREIYLVNPDGSGKRLVYRAPAKKTVLGVDMRRDGGELSFSEVDSDGQTSTWKTITYGASGMGTTTRSISGCRFASDTAADGSVLLVDNMCGGDLKRIAPGENTPVSLGVPRAVFKAAWLPGGSFLYYSAGYVWRATVSSPSGIQVLAYQCIQTLRAAHVTNEALLSCPNTIDRLALDTASLSPNIAQGTDPSFSSDDACFLYVTPPTRGGSLLKIRRFGGTAEVQLGAKANYASVEWRGDSSPATCPAPATSAFEFRTP